MLLSPPNADSRAVQDDFLNDKGYKMSDGSKPVLFIRVIVNEVTGQQTSQSGQATSIKMAHFRILLVLDDSEATAASIELNSTRMMSGGTTRLLVVSRAWTHSNSSSPVLSERDIYFIPGVTPTVNNVLDLLVGKNRHHYKLHDSGSGCRYWTKVVLQDLIGAYYLPAGSDGVVAAIMADIQRTRPNVLMLANADGTFF